jgi:recombination protein RecT
MENVPVRQDATVAAVLNQASVKARFEAMLGKKAAGFMSSVISATQGNKLLKKADPAS